MLEGQGPSCSTDTDGGKIIKQFLMIYDSKKWAAFMTLSEEKIMIIVIITNSSYKFWNFTDLLRKLPNYQQHISESALIAVMNMKFLCGGGAREQTQNPDPERGHLQETEQNNLQQTSASNEIRRQKKKNYKFFKWKLMNLKNTFLSNFI